MVNRDTVDVVYAWKFRASSVEHQLHLLADPAMADNDDGIVDIVMAR